MDTINDWQMKYLGLEQVTDQTYNDIWNIVRPDPENWDYPAQITRYVHEMAKERDTLRTQLAALRAERDALKRAQREHKP